MRSQKPDLIGETVGHIRLVDVLGHGGMGTVYVGEDEMLQRKVAVKAIHGDHRLHREAKARFRREARILSQMNHRNICAVHEFIEDEGSDFLVLELVPGVSLRAAMRTQLDERQKLSIAEQLLEVLVAVHSKGVIHRDLKPENIMVKPDGEIAVLDFGLARSVDEDVAVFPGAPILDLADLEQQVESGDALRAPDGALSVQVKTNRGTIVGSAGYMSPEQARAEPATAASDMYSAGLILQELFTGSPPFKPGLGPMGLVLKAAEGETLPISGLGADLTALIERLTSFAPGARPSSMDALEQLQRIIERPKRRRRRALVAAVWFALVLLAGGMTIQWVRASREAERANREAAAARQVSDFLVGLFEESNPEQARGASLSAEEILQRGAERISGTLEEQPLTRARLLITIGRVFSKMGLYEQAIPLVEEAVEIRTQALGEEHAEVAEALSMLGNCLRNNGDYDEAEARLTRSLELREEIFGPEHLEVADTLHNLGMLCRQAGRFAEAETHLKRALTIYEAELGPNDVRASKSLSNLAILAAQQGRVEDAEPIFRRVLAIQEAELGADHPSVGKARGNLAIALKILGRFDEAEELNRRNLEIMERVLGEDHPEVGVILQNYANLFDQMGRFDEAEKLYLRSLEIQQNNLGADHPEVALSLANLGALYMEQGRWREAETLCLEALAIRERVLDPGHPEIALNLYNLAGVYRMLERYPEAEELYRRSLAIFSAAFEPGHSRRTMVVDELAEFLRERGREEEAAELEAQEAELRPAHAEESL